MGRGLLRPARWPASLRRRVFGEAGSSVVEFALVSILLVMLLFAVVQVAAVFYVRSVVSSAAADGARYAAGSGVDPSDGGPRATSLLSKGLGPVMGRSLPCSGSTVTDAQSGMQAAQVRCEGRIASILVPIGAFVHIDVSARSLREPA